MKNSILDLYQYQTKIRGYVKKERKDKIISLFVQKVLLEINNVYVNDNLAPDDNKVTEVFTTVRERTGYGKTILRPTWATNHIIDQYFNSNNSEEKKITKRSFCNYSTEYSEQDSSGKLLNKHSFKDVEILLNIYNFKHSWPANKISCKVKGLDCAILPERIIGFFSSLKRYLLKNKISDEINVEKVKSYGSCLVFGGFYAEHSELKLDTPIDQIASIYLNKNIDIGLLDSSIENLKICAEIMFRAIEDVENIFRSRFERDSLRTIATLIPEFSNKDVSPSKAVNELLGSLNDTFIKNKNKGHNTNDTDQFYWIRYIAIQHEQKMTDGENFQRPVFSIYPKNDAIANYKGAYLVRSNSIRSVIKYLTYSYLREQNNYHLEPSFSEQYKEIHVSDKEKYRRDNITKGIILTKSNKPDNPWDVLHVEATSGRNTETTAAFLLTKKYHDNESYPFAAIAFESSIKDAFSDSDIEFLGELVNTFESLLSHLKLGDYRVPYSTYFRDAIGKTEVIINSFDNDDSELIGKYIYELLRLDLDGLKSILVYNKESDNMLSDCISQEISNQLLDDLFDEKYESVLPSAKEQAERLRFLGEKVPELLTNWRGIFSKVEVDETILSFFEGIPSNNVWHCYLSSVQQALQERKFHNIKDKTPPSFELFSPGLSAMAMFILQNGDDIQQIIKISNKDKIDAERKKYIEQVRYKIPLAARISEGGYAFDTYDDGNNGYGVLVSDLIGGVNSSRPISFSRIMIKATVGINSEIIDNFDSYLEAINFHFNDNVSAWAGVDVDEEYNNTYSQISSFNAIQLYSRTAELKKKIPNEIKKKTKSFEKIRKYIKRSFSNNEKLKILSFFESVQRYCKSEIGNTTETIKYNKFDNFIKTLNSKMGIASIPSKENLPAKKAYIHGDLNGNNLTWSEVNKRFVLIDFEHVGLGVYGSDQLKLLFSTVFDSNQEANRMLKDGKIDISNLHSWNQVIRKIIKAIHFATVMIGKLDNSNNRIVDATSYDTIFSRIGNVIKKSDDKCLKIVGEIFSTITIPKSSSKASEIRSFWITLIRSFALKHFEYGMINLAASDISCLSKIRESITNNTSINAQLDPTSSNEDYFDVIKMNDEELMDYLNNETECVLTEKICVDIKNKATNYRAVSLFYSYLSLLATLDLE